MSGCSKVPLCLGYTLMKFGTNWLSFVENITVSLQQVNLSHMFRNISGYFAFLVIKKVIIAQILTNFFLFSYKFDKLFSFLKQTGCFRPPVLK